MQAVRGLSNLPSKTYSSSSSSASSSSLQYSPLSKRVLNEISDAIHGHYSIRRRGRAFAATLPSDSSPKPQIGRRKMVTRDERTAMVKDFVDKYRASNAGKYPTPSATKKQVGGSYYVVKNILEQIVYNNNSPTTSTKEECLPLPVVDSSTQSLEEKDESEANKSFEAKEETIIGSMEVPTFEDSIDEETAASGEMQHLESNKKADASYLDLKEAKPKAAAAGQEDSKSNKSKRDDVADPEEEKNRSSSSSSSLWRSLADGLVNLWKRM